MKKLIILFLLLPSLMFSQVSPSKIERIADANTVFGTALSYGTYLVVQSNNKTYKIISVNGVAGTAKLSTLFLNTDYIEEGSVTSVSTAVANNGVTATWSMATPTPALTIGLGAITPTSVNGLTITANGTNTLNITAGKTLTVPLDASVSGTNTGDQTNITGNAGTVTTNANLTGEVTSVGNVATLGSFTSASLATALTNETGTGLAVFGTSPTLVTPNIGTPSSGVATNLTGTAAGLTSGNVTTNANLTGEVTSVGNAATVPNATVIGKVLTGYVSGAGAVAATDNILQAIQKLDGNNGTNANLTGEVTSVGNATTLGSFTSASLSTALTNETGTGSAVFATSPTFVTPALGTPSSGVATNLTGTAAGLTSGNVTTNANLTGEVTSVGNAATVPNATVIGKVLTGYISGAGTVAATDNILQAIQKLDGNNGTNANLTGEVTSVGNATTLGSFTSASLSTALTNETGTGVAVFATSPTLVTPVLGVATATSINGNTITAGTGTLTLAAGKTLTANNTLTLTGTDGSSIAFGTGGTVAYTANKLSVFAATTSAELAGVLSDETGTGLAVFGTTPTLTTPVINGTITGTTVIPIANGGTNSATQNWVDLTTVQTAAGAKTWSALGTFNLGIESTGAAVNLNASSDFATNINTGTSIGNVTIGNAGNYVGVGGAPSGTTYKLEVFGKLKTNAINETSDERYKKDIVTVNNALSKVIALRGVNYLWRIDEFPKNNFDSTLQIGLIAQEIEKIVPEVVRTDDKGFKSVEYSKLVALLIEAVKEQQKTIDIQKSEIGNLKSEAGRIEKLEANMVSLKLLIEGLNKDSKPIQKGK